MVIRFETDAPPQKVRVRHDRLSAPGPEGPALGARMAESGRGWLRRLRRRILPMLVVGAIPFAGAFAYLKIQPPRYETVASVFIDPGQGRGGRADVQVDSAVLEAHIRTITSRPILQKTIERERLIEDSSLFVRATGMSALVEAALSLALGRKAGPVEDRPAAILRLLSEQISAERSGEANLIAISARASEAGTAARLANAVAQTFVDDVIASSEKTQGSDRSRLLARVDELRGKWREAEARLNQFRLQNGVDTTRTPQDLAAELARARTATIDAKAKSDQIQKLLAAGKDIEAIADLVRSPSIERLRIQYNEAAAQEASFRTSLGPRHPAYLEAAEQAREKRRLLTEGLRLAASAARADWQAARDLELQLEKKLGGDAAATAMPIPGQLRELEREVDLAKLAYDRQMRMLEAADGALQAPAARIVARAAAPAQPVATGRTRLWLAALGAALVAMLVVFSIGSTARPTRARPLKDKADSAGWWRLKKAETPVDAVRPPPAPRMEAPPVAAAEPDATDRIAHEVAERGEEFAVQVTLVTALQPTPDKTAIALRLAAAATRRDVRVLLIDAGEDGKGLTERFAAHPAYATIRLQGRDRLIVEAEAAPGAKVWVIPNGADRAAPANDARLPHFDAIGGHFDLVILDGPAVSGGLGVRRLARTAQSVVAVVPPGQSADPARLAASLDIAGDTLRLVPGEHPATAPDAGLSKPMSIVRLRQCA